MTALSSLDSSSIAALISAWMSRSTDKQPTNSFPTWNDDLLASMGRKCFACTTSSRTIWYRPFSVLILLEISLLVPTPVLLADDERFTFLPSRLSMSSSCGIRMRYISCDPLSAPFSGLSGKNDSLSMRKSTFNEHSSMSQNFTGRAKEYDAEKQEVANSSR